MKVSIGKAAKDLGVSPEPLRRWEAAGKIRGERTPGGHRRCDLTSLRGWSRTEPALNDRGTRAYARVSSRDPQADLARQVEWRETFCAANGWRYDVIRDLGSGLNDPKRGHRELLRRIGSSQVGRLVGAHQDRLRRFGSAWVFSLCEQVGTEVGILHASEEASCEDERGPDVLEIITGCSARLYGSRSRKTRDILTRRKEAADAIRPEDASGSG
jgi:putative resolvase